MQCNVCGKVEASIHLTEIVNNSMTEVHLCEKCAQEKGELGAQFSFSDLLSGLSEWTPSPTGAGEVRHACPSCGFSLVDFGKAGRLGCPDCYYNLKKILLPLIKRVQHSTRHVGKRPSRVSSGAGQTEKRQLVMRDLEEALQKYVAEENYEQAAAVRDEIRKLTDAAKPPAAAKEESPEKKKRKDKSKERPGA